MKKTLLTIAIVLGLSLSTFAQWGGGLFQRGAVSEDEYNGTYYYGFQNRIDNGGLIGPNIPYLHGANNDQDATPLGSGALLLIGLGAGYALMKKRTPKE